MRWALVTAEVALAVVLLAGGSLLARDYARLRSWDPGYDTSGRLVVSLALPRARFEDGPARLRFLEEVGGRLGALPGAASVSWASHLPVSDGSTTGAVTVEGGPQSEPGSLVLANMRRVGPGYFETMGMSLAEGRFPTDAEVRDGAPVVVLSRSAAARYWPGQGAVGRRVRLGLAEREGAWYEVVGVLREVREEWELSDTWYLPATGAALDRAWIVLATHTGGAGLATAVRGAIWDVDADQPIERVAELSALADETLTSERVGTGVVAGFALIGLLLAVLGVYGVVSYTVTRSRREMGIRLALGAEPLRVKSLVLRRGASMVGAGLLLGGAGATLITGRLARFLAGEGALEVRTLGEGGTLGPGDYLLVFGVIGGVAAVACYLPARRASRVDPALILKEE